tara:strand:+ start:1711 stop:2055 length:345 start_codon:yes stop_codon:yes gene_type:complete
MEPSYNRLADWGDRTNRGSKTIRTSGNYSQTGQAVFTQDWYLHSYVVNTMDGGSWDGEFSIEVSNDNVNYVSIYKESITAATGLAYSDTWTFAYARPVITGTQGNFLITERHLG